MTALTEEAVPAVALQKFLFHLRSRQWEKAKALAFQSAPPRNTKTRPAEEVWAHPAVRLAPIRP